MLKLVINALLVFLQAFNFWSRERERQAGRDAERAARASKAAQDFEADRRAAETADRTSAGDMLGINDRLRDRTKRD